MIKTERTFLPCMSTGERLFDFFARGGDSRFPDSLPNRGIGKKEKVSPFLSHGSSFGLGRREDVGALSPLYRPLEEPARGISRLGPKENSM